MTFKTLKKKLYNCRQLPKTIIFRNGIKSYWWTGRTNFGDLITPELLEYFGYTPILTKVKDSQLLATGSILDRADSDYNGFVLGAGLIKEQKKTLPEAKILGVRGNLTRECLGLDESVPLGDPGLLAPLLLDEKVTKNSKVIGIVPHYVDKNDKSIENLFSGNLNIKIIDVEKKPKEVFKEISSCEFVFSSSLHGLITADAFGIPNSWIKFSTKIAGNDFKFHDYYSSMEETRQPILVDGSIDIDEMINGSRLADSKKITELSEGLKNNFLNLENI